MSEIRDRKDRYMKAPDVERRKDNPFREALVYPPDRVRRDKMKTVGTVGGSGGGGWITQPMNLVNEKTGELLPAASLVMNVRKTVDSDRFIKLYAGGVAAIFDLSAGAQKVLRSLLWSYNGDDTWGDLIFFNFREAVSAGYQHKRTAFRSGLNEIMLREVICPAARGEGWYWLNPTLFYRGDRMAIINEYIRESTTIEVKAEKKAPDAELDQIDLFSGTTKREECE